VADLVGATREHGGAVAVPTLNRPEKLNALSVPLLEAFEAELDAPAADPAVRVLVLTGAGGKAFAGVSKTWGATP